MDVLSGYRDNRRASSDEDSEDSDKECSVWKRATVRKFEETEDLPNNGPVESSSALPNNGQAEVCPPEQKMPATKRKRNTIWCDVLEDQLISEDFEDCLLKNRPRNSEDRGKESYDFTLRYADDRCERDSDSVMSDGSLDEEDSSSAIDCSLNASKFKRKKLCMPNKTFRKFVKLDSAELEASRKINKVLNEKKYYLIQRIVKYAGIDRAMHLLQLTKEIEENGGMMIKSNSRRRTPGGVYIQMLKSDKGVTKEMIDKIFEGEMSGMDARKFYNQKKDKKKNFQKNKMNLVHKESSSSTEMIGNLEPMEASETVPMEAEVAIFNPSPEISNLDAKVPAIEKSPGHVSDLEEGEIED